MLSGKKSHVNTVFLILGKMSVFAYHLFRKMLVFRKVLVAWVCWMFVTVPSQSLAGTWQSSAGWFHGQGDFYQETDTSFWSVPLSWKWKQRPWQFKLSVPWVQLDGPGTIDTVTAGSAVRTAKESGLGDVGTQFTYQWQRPLWQAYWLDTSIKIKWPTADDKKGLGTGKTDVMLETEWLRQVGSGWGLMRLGHQWRGEPEDRILEDRWRVGLGWLWNYSQPYTLGVFYDFKESSVPDRSPIQEWMLFWQQKRADGGALQGFLIVGTTTSSMDVGVGMTYRFGWEKNRKTQ